MFRGAAVLLVLGLAAVVPRVREWDDTSSAAQECWQHRGPGVASGRTGPARFVPALFEAFSSERAIASARFADRFYRTPGGEGYEATLEHLAERLRDAGYGEEQGFELVFLESEMEAPAWTPRSARLELVREEGPGEVLHAFDSSEDVDRTMLPVHAPCAEVEGRPVFRLGDVTAGCVLVTDAWVTESLIERARERGAKALLSSALHPFTEDPTGAERHLDAILFTELPPDTVLPVAQISPRTHARIETAAKEGVVLLRFRAEVVRGSTRIRTLCATVRGTTRPGDAVVVASHVQEPGAGDNASGAAGLLEIACAFPGCIEDEKLPRPERSIVFLWGDECRQSRVWLEQSGMRAAAGIAADMLGQSPERTGAIALIERMQDPGALEPLPPDEHTPWGAGKVAPADIRPNGLALVARMAFSDVARHSGGWVSGENPWEGGSDHDEFLRLGIPAVLIWHFTDFTYHTSLDRMDMVDADELERSATAVAALALALAAPRAQDLARYLRSNEIERELRAQAAEEAGNPEIAEHWEQWCEGAERWLRELCTAVRSDER